MIHVTVVFWNHIHIYTYIHSYMYTYIHVCISSSPLKSALKPHIFAASHISIMTFDNVNM